MDARFIALAVPFFFSTMGIELWVNLKRGAALYRFHDSLTNLACGIGQQMLGLILQAGLLFTYAYVWEHYRLFDIPDGSPLAWAGVMLGVDFCYYWLHRASHRVNFLWAAHIVHHQSEEYNLSVALRQSWLQQVVGIPFYLPLAIIGFSPVLGTAGLTLSTLYQFWIHTRAVKTLGPLEWVLNTPSHHRVHHGVNAKYIDRNYGAILVVWDRPFGSFQREQEEPTYGTVVPLASWSSLWANAEHWVRMARMARRAERWRHKLWVWVAPPEWDPPDASAAAPLADEGAARERQPKYDVEAAPGVRAYVAVSFVASVVATTWILWVQAELPRSQLWAVALVILVTSIGWGGLVERRAWALPLELLRLFGAAAVGAWVSLSAGLPAAAVAAAALALASAGWLLRLRPRAVVGVPATS